MIWDLIRCAFGYHQWVYWRRGIDFCKRERCRAKRIWPVYFG